MSSVTSTQPETTAPLRVPGPQSIAKARQYCSQAFYAYQARPSANDSRRALWNEQFTKVIMKITRFLKTFQVTELPAFIIAAVHQYNVSVRTSAPFDAEGIIVTPASRLQYTPREDGVISYLPSK